MWYCSNWHEFYERKKDLKFLVQNLSLKLKWVFYSQIMSKDITVLNVMNQSQSNMELYITESGVR